MAVAAENGTIRNEIRALTGLRAIAAGWVVLHHFWALTPSANWPIVEPIRPLLATGWLGVDLFFVLSGYVLTHTYMHKMGDRPTVKTAASFYWNRLCRVWPLWAFVTIAFTGFLVLKHLTVGGDHLHEGAQPTVGPLALLEQLLRVQVWSTPVPYATGSVGPGWSLSAEWLAYCLFPLTIVVLYRMRRLPAVVLGSAAVLAMLPFAAHVAAEAHHDFAWSWAFRIAGGFLAGALASMCIRRIQVGADTARRATVVAGAAIVQVLVVIWWAVQDGGDYAGIAVVLFPVLVGALALADGGAARWLGVPWVVMGGRISFALYLVHECIFEVFWTAMDVLPVLGPESRWQALVAPLVLVSTVPAAYLLWRFVEEPSRRAMRDLVKRRSAAPVEPAEVTARTSRFQPELAARVELPRVPEQRVRAQEELVSS